MRTRDFALFFKRIIDARAVDERPKRATVTSVANWNETGEVEATLVDGRKVYIHAVTIEEIAVDDILLVTPQNLGIGRAQWHYQGMHEMANGSRVPQIRRALEPETVLTDDSGNRLLDDSGNLLHDN